MKKKLTMILLALVLCTTSLFTVDMKANAEETDDGIIIHGGKELTGGTVESYNDHRIVMSASILSGLCKNNVIITDSNAVEKSYPDFFNDFNKMGGKANVLNDR